MRGRVRYGKVPAVVEAPGELHGLGPPTRQIGRYALFGEIASGGMATVYFGRRVGAVGFSRSVAIKQLHPQYAKSPEFVAQFLDEAQLSSRVRHPNVVSVLDVVARDGELFVVMEFVAGEPLSRLVHFAEAPMPIPVASAILIQVLLGLHAAHEATTESGEPLQIVHRDVSPQNMLVGVDGAAHLLDFGVAKAASKLHTTEHGQIKGKIPYMAPEQLRGDAIDRRADVFAAGIVLWELLTGERLFARDDPGATVTAVLSGLIKAPTQLRPEISPRLEALVLKALQHPREGRFASAREMALALEACAPPASSLTVGAWVESIAGASLKERAQRLREAEEHTGVNLVADVAALQRRLSDRAPLPEGNLVSDPALSAITSIEGRRSAWVLRRSARPWLVRAGAATALLLIVALALLAYRPPRVPEHPQASVPSPRVEITTADPTRTPAAALEARGAEPAPVAESEPLAPAPSAPPVRPASAPRALRKPAKVDAVSQNCLPPYVLDAQGRKRFKPECF
jgi:serine/threonine protein kinase